MTRGTIVNKVTGLEIHGNLESKYPARGGWFDFKIEGTSVSNSFENDDWDFNEDLPDLPTKYGLYQKADSQAPVEHEVTYRHAEAGWMNALDNRELTLLELRILRTIPLVRLVREMDR